MTLIEHLREFRNRLFVSVCAVVVGFVLGWIFYEQILEVLRRPFDNTVAELAKREHSDTRLVLDGVTGGFLLQTKVSLVAGIVIASPVWLYELWAFIMPGLHQRERKWTLMFVAVAGPLFMAGVVLGYFVMPKGLEVLLNFTPVGISNFINISQYLNFVLRILLVFGISFEIPLFVVLLNLAGVVRARQLAKYRSWIIFVTFIFAAVATPSTDPITMLLLALPMAFLFLLSELIAKVVDRRRGRDREPEYDAWDDDEVSPLAGPTDPEDQ